ncbi:MAG: NADH-quinone oxidoreductase subunit H [Elusimicrobia bacterium]|jgi:NADH-quinone oxidoreductase subunit H|nr:NADH-quinone oxidoreductase subunit H [Elusimicrobiota bacterium]
MEMIFFDYIIFPGILFTLAAAMAVSWIDRKVTALLQWRVGPPVLQPFYDFWKLFKKETVIPKGGSVMVFLLSPAVSFSALILVSVILLKTTLTSMAYIGDIFVVIYLLLIPSIAVIMSGAASSNPLASLGASREMKMVLSYELPFILAVCVVLIKTGGITDLAGIVAYQNVHGAFIGSLSGFLAFAVTVVCFQSKMAQVPFDIPEAEQEIMGGAMIEYSGPPLALFVAARWILMALLPLLITMLYLGGIHSALGILKYVGVVVLVILIKNTNPRLRINQTLRFFWGIVTGVAAVSIILAFLGL